ncbi:hypothetical protein [Streptomyces sp. NPDC056632]|uniref:hypothetical protein n=1 Tax=Streptomyces sp. NPDC056632 TaxID=3345884 RepID=UPI00367B45A9
MTSANYPRTDGDLTTLGPEPFTNSTGDVLCWKGENYTRQSALDGAYRERARLVALVAGCLAEQAVVAPAPDVDEPGGQILYATLHGRQCSWHYSPRDADLIEHLEHVPADDPRAQWDGHTAEAKYEHIDYVARALGTPGPFQDH